MVVVAIDKSGLFKELGMLVVGIPADQGEQQHSVYVRRRRNLNLRWSGTESTHLFSAESSSTMCCFQCSAMKPRKTRLFFNEYCNKGSVILQGREKRRQILTIVLTSTASTSLSFNLWTKAVINEGFSAGCLKTMGCLRKVGVEKGVDASSSCSKVNQYSSSHSIGKSRSKLRQ